MIVAVTGGTGFIGSHLVAALTSRGDEVRLLSRSVGNSGNNIAHFPVDYRNRDSLLPALKNCDLVIHLAAALRAPKQSDLIEINRSTTASLLSATREAAPNARFILCSSQAAAGPAIDHRPRTELDPSEPISWYGRSKRAAEEVLLTEEKLSWTILRPPAVFGPRERDIFVFFKALARGWSTQIGTVRRQFSWIYAKDFVAAILIASMNDALNHKVNFVTSGATDWDEFRAAAAAALNRKYRLATLPRWSAQLLAESGELWSKISGKAVLLNRDKIAELTYDDWRCDDSNFRRLTGYVPQYSLSAAVAETIAWYRSEGWL